MAVERTLCTNEMQCRCKRSWLKHRGQNMSQRYKPELCMYATLLFCQRRPLAAMRRDTSCACMHAIQSFACLGAAKSAASIHVVSSKNLSFSRSQNLLGHINWTKQLISVQNEPFKINSEARSRGIVCEPLQSVKSGRCS